MSRLQRISEHIYWLPPAAPDRPSLCAVVGDSLVVVLDAGASDAHAREFLDLLRQEGIKPPDFVVLTHWHWDHVFGAAEMQCPVIAHQLTARQIRVMQGYTWTDDAIDARVETGEEIVFCAENIKLELPSPRQVRIAPVTFIYEQTLQIDLGGGVTCSLVHVGGDHASDSTVIDVSPDGVLFLGDCWYDAVYTPVRHYTPARLSALLDRLERFDARLYVEGHGDAVLDREKFLQITTSARLAVELVGQFEDEAALIVAYTERAGHVPDEDALFIIRALLAGRQFDRHE